MPKVNRYIDIDTVERESKKDYIDRHSPFIYVEQEARLGEKLRVKVKVGKDYLHPDDFDHYIANISLYNGEVLLAKAEYFAGTLGGQDEKSQLEIDFFIVPTTKKLKLTAQAYCTKHGIWESDPLIIETK